MKTPEPISSLHGAALAVGSGLLHVALFPPFDESWLAWFVLSPFLVALLRARETSHGVLFGAAIGIQISAAVYWWLPGMLVQFFQMSTVLAWILGVLGAFYLAVPYAAFGGWVVALAKRGKVSALGMAAAWTLAEYLSGHWLIPNRLGLLAHSQVTAELSIQMVDLVGQYGMGFVIALVNAALAVVMIRRRPTRGQWAEIAFAGLVVAMVFAYGAKATVREWDGGERAEVALVQGAIEHEFFRRPENRKRSFERYIAMTSELMESGPAPDLIFWPEWAADVPIGLDSIESQGHLARLGWFDSELVMGGPHKVTSPEGDFRSRNSVFLVSNGSIEGRYDKMKLIPVAESSPGPLFVRFWKRPYYSPGERFMALPSEHGGLGVMICSESTHAAVARAAVGAGAHLLVNPSNDYWFGRREPARLQLNVAVIRAIENRRYLVRPTSTGFSAVIDPSGDIVAAVPPRGARTLRATVYFSDETTPYQRGGDLMAWLAMLVVVAGSIGGLKGEPVDK